MPYKTTQPFLAQGGKIDPISEIRNAGLITSGDVYWVSRVADGQHRKRTDDLGRDVVKTGPQAAIDACLADNDDYVFFIPPDDNTAWSLGTALDVNKDRVHLIGAGYTKSKYGYAITIAAATGTSPDSEVVAVTGDGVEMAGLMLQGTMGTNAGGTVSNGNLYVNAHDFWGHDLHIEQKVDGWDESPCYLNAASKHGARFDDCTFSVNGTGNVEASSTGVVSLGHSGKRQEFHNCTFSMPAGSTSDVFVAAGTGAKNWVLFKNCDFINQDVSYSVASAITGSITVDNPVAALNCTVVACAEIGTDASVYVAPVASGTAAAVYNPNITVGSSAIVAA